MRQHHRISQTRSILPSNNIHTASIPETVVPAEVRFLGSIMYAVGRECVVHVLTTNEKTEPYTRRDRHLRIEADLTRSTRSWEGNLADHGELICM